MMFSKFRPLAVTVVLAACSLTPLQALGQNAPSGYLNGAPLNYVPPPPLTDRAVIQLDLVQVRAA